MLRENLIAQMHILEKSEKPQINNLNSKLKERIMKTNPKREQEELLKIRTKINKFEAEKNWRNPAGSLKRSMKLTNLYCSIEKKWCITISYQPTNVAN